MSEVPDSITVEVDNRTGAYVLAEHHRLTPEGMSDALDRLFSDTALQPLRVPAELVRRLPTPVPTYVYPIELPGGAELLAWIEPTDDEKGGET